MDTVKLKWMGLLLTLLYLSLAGCGGGGGGGNNDCVGCTSSVSGTPSGYSTTGLAPTLTDTSANSTLQSQTKIASTGDTYTISGTNTTGATVSISGSSLTNAPTSTARFSFNALYGDTVTLDAALPENTCTVSAFTNPISSNVSDLTISCSLVSTAVVSTLAGSGAFGSADSDDCTVASFNTPAGVAVDASGNVYVADTGNDLIRKITPAGVVSTLAGSGAYGNANGTGAAASFFAPYGVAVDGSGNVYVGDWGNQLIRKITPAGVVSTLAGSGAFGNANGTGTAASFKDPEGVAVDSSGNVYVADTFNHLIRKITPTGVVSTLAGSGAQGSADGTGTAASFNDPTGVAVDGSGNVYVADAANHLIRKISPAGVVSTLAGSGDRGNVNGTGTAASFNVPYGVAVDSSDNVYVADSANNLIRKITPTGVVSTLAGSGDRGDANGTGTAASFFEPYGVAVDGNGNVYVADSRNNLIRKITP